MKTKPTTVIGAISCSELAAPHRCNSVEKSILSAFNLAIFLMFGTLATTTLMRQSPIPLVIDDSTLLGTRFSGHNKVGKEGR
jgi:hypothetical protein